MRQPAEVQQVVMALLVFGCLACDVAMGAPAGVVRKPGLAGRLSPQGAAVSSIRSTPTSANCSERWYIQHSDHFNWADPVSAPVHFLQRFFVYDSFWGGPGSPIFFYAGNEGDVTLYINHTGLMWESAPKLKAMLVFAEHRYYGESLLGKGNKTSLSYLTHEQALADYATLVHSLQANLSAAGSPVIAFGGSYGGMLSAWLRLKYPGTFAGAISASAPILAFCDMETNYHSETYWQVVTRDATPDAGAPAPCAPNFRRAWKELFARGNSTLGLKSLSEIFRMCSPITFHDVNRLAMMLMMAIDTMAMGAFVDKPSLELDQSLLPATS